MAIAEQNGTHTDNQGAPPLQMGDVVIACEGCGCAVTPDEVENGRCLYCPLTVGELIAALKDIDPNQPVLVEGVKFGYDTFSVRALTVRTQPVVESGFAPQPNWAGRFLEPCAEDDDGIEATLLARVDA